MKGRQRFFRKALIAAKVACACAVIALISQSSATAPKANAAPTQTDPQTTQASPAKESISKKNSPSPNQSTQTQKEAPAERLAARETPIKENDAAYPVRVYKALTIPNDPFADQWAFSAVNAPVAWDIPAGNTASTIAVIDTGMAMDHEEFDGRWFTNTGETGTAATEAASSLNCSDRNLELDANCNLIDDNGDGTVDNESGDAWYENPSQLNCTDRGLPIAKDCNRIDDDANGYADDVHGWDFINHDNSTQAGENNPFGSGTMHGSEVAGIAAASGNNNKGIAGIDWAASILPIQALDDDGYGDTKSVGRAINYAVMQGADVISLSLGTTLADPYVKQAVESALRQGIPVVAASGNDGCDCMVYPAAYPEVLAVGATGTNNLRASFSSYGTNLDIVAPGVNLSAPTWINENGVSAYATSLNGTSFATPLVSGSLSRIKSQQPEASPSQLMAALTEFTNRTNSKSPHDSQLGFGMLDVGSSSARMSDPQNNKQLYAYAASTGAYLLPSSPFEVAGAQQYTHRCNSDMSAGTRIFQLQKGGEKFMTISPAEVEYATTQGFTQKKMWYACMTQPHDSIEKVRVLGMNEF